MRKLTTFEVTMEVRAYNSNGKYEKKPFKVCAETSQEATCKALQYAKMLELDTRFILSVIETPDEICYTHHYND